MGLLDRWSKKKTEEKLKAVGGGEEKKTEKSAAQDKVKGMDEKPVAAAISAKVGGIAYKILARPLVTEKSAIAESHNKYTFVVNRYASKDEVRNAIAEAYGVRPIAVNIINVEGKRARFGRSMGKRSDYRKAIVTLSAGKIINIHEGV